MKLFNLITALIITISVANFACASDRSECASGQKDKKLTLTQSVFEKDDSLGNSNQGDQALQDQSEYSGPVESPSLESPN